MEFEMFVQKILGLALIVLSITFMMLFRDDDMSYALVLIPLGVYLVLTRNCVM